MSCSTEPTREKVVAGLVVGLVALSLLLVPFNGLAGEGNPTSQVQTEALVVGTSPGFRPFEFYQDEQLVGLDIDLMKEIGRVTGFDIQWKEYSFDSLIPALTSGEVDCIISALTITEEREKDIDFSDPYLNYGIAVQEGNSQLLNKIDNGLDTLQDEGIYQRLRSEWLGDNVIGAIFPESGALSSYGQPIKKASKLAANSLDTVLGDSFRLISRDTGTNINTGISAAENLVLKEEVPAVVGALSSGVTLPVAQEVTIPNEVVQITPASTAPNISSLSDEDYVFRTVASDDFQGEALGELAAEKGISSLSILYVNNSYGNGVSDAVTWSFSARGGDVKAKVSFERDQGSYIDEVNQALQDQPEALVVVGYPSSGAKVINRAVESGFSGKFFLPDGLKDPGLIDQVGAKALEGAYVTTLVTEETKSTEIFRSEYKNKYGKLPPKPFMANAYDSVALLGLAMESAGSASAHSIRNHLRDVSNPPGQKVYAGRENLQNALGLLSEGQEINYQGASGPITFDAAGDVSGNINVWKIKDGEFKREKGDEQTKVGLAFSSGGIGDKSFNDSVSQGLKYVLQGSTRIEGISALSVDTMVVTPEGGNNKGAIRKLVRNNCELIIGVGFTYSPVVKELAGQYPETKFAVVDFARDNPGSNVRGITFNSYQGSFLAGAAAALATESNKVGFIGGMDVSLIQKFESGFKAGVNHINSQISIATDYVGSFGNPGEGNRLAKEQFNSGVDVIFPAAGLSTLGVHKAAEEKGKYTIGVDADQNYIQPGHVLTSMLKRVDIAVYDTVADFVNGSFTGGNIVEYGLEDEGVGIALDVFNRVEEHPEQVTELEETGSIWLPGLGVTTIPEEKIQRLPESNLISDETVSKLEQVESYLKNAHSIFYVVTHWDTEDDKLNPDLPCQVSTNQVLQAIAWWADGATVPRTGGKTMSTNQVLDLIASWADGDCVG